MANKEFLELILNKCIDSLSDSFISYVSRKDREFYLGKRSAYRDCLEFIKHPEVFEIEFFSKN